MLFSPPVHLSIVRRRLGGLTASAALHAAVVLSATGLQSEPASGATASAAGPIVVAVAADAVTSQRSDQDQSDKVEARPALEIAGVAIDLGKILARRDELFPFLALDTSLWNRARARREDDPVSLRNPLAGAAGASLRPPLQLSDRALQALVDRASSRRERGRPFAPIAVLLEAHDPDDGRAAALVQGTASRTCCSRITTVRHAMRASGRCSALPPTTSRSSTWWPVHAAASGEQGHDRVDVPAG